MKQKSSTFWSKLIAISIIMLPTFYFGFIGKPTEMGIMVVAGSLAVAFLNIDKIQKFKGAGFEAEMKKIVDEAYATLDNLKSVASPLIVTTIDSLTWSKRWGNSESGRDEEIFCKLMELIDEMNLVDDKIRNAIDEHYSLKIFDKYSEFKKVYKDSQAELKRSASELNEIENLLNGIADYRVNRFPSKDAILKELGIEESGLTKEVLVSLNEYISYLNDIGTKISSKQ